jgi:CubicO group peptidase (beta-lactamase class C family)
MAQYQILERAMIKGDCAYQFQNVKDVFSNALESGFETGAALTIEHKGEIVVNLWGGYQDKKKTKEWKENTLVNVWSVTKGVTATCISRLIDQGKLDPNKRVTEYWPEYSCNDKEDTKVSDFLCHRAAMFGFQGGLPSGSWQDWNKFVHQLESQAPYRQPGVSQGYHALTYGWLVGELIRRVDGRTVGKYFQEEIALPFDIDFHIGLSKEDFGRCADMLMIEMDDIKLPGGFLKYVPNIFLPQKIKNFKAALQSGDFNEAFQGRDEDDINYPNSEDWRLAEIPSANGHGTAESLAKLYGILSNGCTRDGISIMNQDTLKLAISPHSSGPDSVLFGAGIKFGLGYELAQGIATVGNISPTLNDKMFGHAGVGGAVGFGDPEEGLGYGFICNQQHDAKDLYRTSNQLTEALYSAIKNI